MREVPKKNYYILLVLLIVTILVTLILSNLYINKDKPISDFYKYSNKITVDDFDQYMLENSDVIIYISDKYNLKNETIEKKLKNKIEKLNLKQNLIYIEKSEINKQFLNKFEKNYKIDINLKKAPLIIVVVDDKVIRNEMITENIDLDSVIKSEDFK